ncbi:MAG TPA: nuclear transport factor 2 family protein [Propionibacteriaceae bacterium]|nr:nuclear transport factor 2 family protein [Propionibacteriaceae bacterium]
MDESTVRAMIEDHFDTATDNFVQSSEIYADDAVLEFPQSGERIRGKANIIAFRSAYPARVTFDRLRTIGRHDLWVNEYVIRYDDQTSLNVVGIMEFRDDKVVRERIYFGEPWEPPAWRAQWVEPMDEPDSSHGR